MLAVSAVSVHPEDPLAGLALLDREAPAPPAGWTLVRVLAASVNHHDIWTLRGVGIDPACLPVVLGCDAAGVTADGREVIVHAVIAGRDGLGDPAQPDETLAPHRSLLSERYDGTMADWVAVPERNLIPKPGGLSFAEAACLPTAYLTAYRALFTQAQLKPGERLLIQGAGGGVATAGILLARAAGLQVWVTSRSTQKAQRALDTGAHAAFGAGDRLPDRVDAVLDTVGAATWGHSLRALRPGGALLMVGATSGANPPADLQRVFFRQLRIIGSTMGTRSELTSLVQLLLATGVRPLIDATVALTQARSAFSRLLAGEVFGKVVLTAEPRG